MTPARSGRPLDATGEDMCKKVRDLVYSDRRIQVEELAQALDISHGSVLTILPDHLGMRKLTIRWVPKSLSDEQMATRASVCSALLKRFRSTDKFPLRLLTVGETWVYYYEPVNKAQSRQWVGPGPGYYVGPFTQEKYNNRSVLCKPARPAENCHP